MPPTTPHLIVKLFTDPAAGGVKTHPFPVKVKRGSSLAWTSEEGTFKVSFADESPFEGAETEFAGAKDGMSTPVTIKSDARSGVFVCRASIGGKAAVSAYGIEV